MYYSGAPFAFKENKNVRSLLAYISKKGFSVGATLPPERGLAEQSAPRRITPVSGTR